MPHRGLPDQRERIVFAEAMVTHQLQYGTEDHTPGADPVFELLDIGRTLAAPLRAIEGDHERGVETGGAQRLDQERGGLQIKQPFQPAWGLGADQGDYRHTRLERGSAVGLDRDAV